MALGVSAGLLGFLAMFGKGKKKNMGLVAYYKFDETTGNIAYDSSGLNNHATIYYDDESATGIPAPPNASIWTAGKIGNAFSVRGRSYIAYPPYSSAVDNFDAFTIACWVFSTRKNPGVTKHYLFDKGGGVLPGDILIYFNGNIEGTGLFFQTVDSGGVKLSGLGPIPLNEWYHLACVFQRGQRNKMYINGVLADASSDVTKDERLSHAVSFGIGDSVELIAQGWNYERKPFYGDVDEFYIFNTALSPEEIQLVMNSNFTKKTGVWVSPSTPFSGTSDGAATSDLGSRLRTMHRTTSLTPL